MAKAPVNITPLGNRVLLKSVDVQEEVKGGIIIPDSAKEKPTTAEVIALGYGKVTDGEKHEFSVKVGDTVIVSKYGGTVVKYDDTEYTIMAEDDILGIIVK